MKFWELSGKTHSRTIWLEDETIYFTRGLCNGSCHGVSSGQCNLPAITLPGSVRMWYMYLRSCCRLVANHRNWCTNPSRGRPQPLHPCVRNWASCKHHWQIEATRTHAMETLSCKDAQSRPKLPRHSQSQCATRRCPEKVLSCSCPRHGVWTSLSQEPINGKKSLSKRNLAALLCGRLKSKWWK